MADLEEHPSGFLMLRPSDTQRNDESLQGCSDMTFLQLLEELQGRGAGNGAGE